MKNLKVDCSGLRCPHCGSSKLHILRGDVFLCEYCDEKTSFDLDELNLSERKVLVEDLKTRFSERAQTLYAKERELRAKLIYYKKLIEHRRLTIISGVGVTISILAFLTFAWVTMVVGGFGTIIFSVLLIIAKKLREESRKLYQPYVTKYAREIVEIQSEIDLYISLISRLTK